MKRSIPAHRATGGARAARVAGACAAALGVYPALAPASASAATLSVQSSCVVYDQATVDAGVPFTAIGFTPGDELSFASTPSGVQGDGSIDSTGSASGTFEPPAPPHQTTPGTSTITLRATDDPGISAATTFLEAPLALDTVPARAKPTQKVTFNFSGFGAGKPIYAHYTHAGKVVTTRRFGVTKGPCGLLTTKATFYSGTWKYPSFTIQFDDSATYSPNTSPRLRSTLSKD